MSLRWRLILIGLTVALFGWYTAANFIPEETRVASPFLPDEGLRLGLDLQGGIHWVLGVKLEVAEEQELDFMRDRLADAADDEDEGFAVGDVDIENARLFVQAPTAASEEAIRAWATETRVLRVVGQSEGRLEFALTDDWREEVRRRGMEQVLEVLRRRIDDPVRGIPDSVVTRQGEDRVLVQIPGGQIDRSRARELLRVTGFLEFKIVQAIQPTEELLRADFPDGLPDETEIVFERDKETQRILNAYLVSESADITGQYLTDARLDFDRQGRPTVSFTFSSEGGQIFAKLTSENIDRPLAIILDDQVYSAPNIRARISTRGVIEGRFTSQEAADLAVVLRAGSLAVPVVIEEERTVGPTLGQDSIDQGVRAAALGLVLIAFFIVGYYRLSGGYAAIALFVNLLLLMGLMSMFAATLTLPGLAGIVLTVGMAVDANVIIFERIREELRQSKTPRAAVSTGFQKATRAILDANITTLMTAIVLYQFGTGPIKGFAVTLSVGVITSVFAALVVTRAMYAINPGTRHVEALSI